VCRERFNFAATDVGLRHSSKEVIHQVIPQNTFGAFNEFIPASYVGSGSKPDLSGMSTFGAKRAFGKMAMSAKCHEQTSS
jgi:hypothetical protein